METQLRLLDTPKDWHLDPETREVGRKGLEAARAALAAARAARHTPGDQQAA